MVVMGSMFQIIAHQENLYNYCNPDITLSEY